MAGLITDKFSKASAGTRAEPTTLTAQKGIGDAAITCASLVTWPTATAVHFQIYTTDTQGNIESGSQSDWKGIVVGSTITQLTLEAGSDDIYPIGSVVVCLPTAGWADDLVEGILVSHNQDGSLKDAGITTAKLANGSVTPIKWANVYKFNVTLTNAFALNVGSGVTKIPFNSERFDTNNNYDATTNFRYTAPVSGYYQFDACVHTAVIGALRRVQIFLYKNGVAYEGGDENTRSDLAIGVSYSSLIQLAATDYVEIFCFCNDGQDIDNTAGNTRFSGYLVSQT